MDKEKLHFIVLAALLHDIGKLFERGEIFAEARKDHICLEACPKKNGGSPSHLHAAHTRAFCDWIEEKFGCLARAEDRSWKDWCAAHHRNDEYDLEFSVIRIADRLSSSEREEGDYYRRRIHQKTLLEPVLERVFLNENQNNLTTRYRYPLKRATAKKEGLFAIKGESLGLKEMDAAAGPIFNPTTWTHLISKKPMVDEYRQLGEEFMDEVSALSAQCPDIDLAHLITCLTTLLERYTANVPSATNIRHPDISLFDHLRSTAAIAQSLYFFQLPKENPKKGIEDGDDHKWLLACGDFSGIQKFIYNLTNKGAAKGLRGRSFYVQYFCKICAEFIVREIGLSQSALLYNSGGKFYLLLPANLKKELYQARAKINQCLLKKFSGDMFFGLGLARISSDMFSQGEMHAAWKEAAEDLKKDRLSKFREFLNNDFFEPEVDFDPTKSCPVCGSRKVFGAGDACDACKELELLGTWLRDTQAIITIWENEGKYVDVAGVFPKTAERIIEFDEFKARCLFVHPTEIRSIYKLNKIPGECVFLNQLGDMPFQHMNIGSEKIKLPNCAISNMYIGKWEADRQFTEHHQPWDFQDYAENSRGIRRLGILRMDVDNLGDIFIRGLRFPVRADITVDGKIKSGWGAVSKDESGDIVHKHMASISRMVTLSRQLKNYFSGYVPLLLAQPEFDRCQIIYAGGDDLFVIGSWDQLPDLAKTIRRDFKSFCCNNPDFSISGGITLQRGKYPFYKGAKIAGDAEKQAKDLRSFRGVAKHDQHKDSFCFLGVAIAWEDMDLAERIVFILESEIKSNRGLLSYLSQMTAANKVAVSALIRSKAITVAQAWKEIEYGPWRWRTAYQLRRRYKDQPARQIWADILFASQYKGSGATLPVYTWLELPLRWTDYLYREKGGK